MSTRYDAIVLAGGRSRRMGGKDKTRLPVGGQPVLDRVVAAAAGAGLVVVVGERRPLAGREVVWCREEPPGSGPAAAVAAALPLVRAEQVVLLAGDLPLVSGRVLERLCSSMCSDGAVAVDEGGRPQWLASVWRTQALAGTGLRPGGSLAASLGALRWDAVSIGDDSSLLDCDTPEDLERARGLLG